MRFMWGGDFTKIGGETRSRIASIEKATGKATVWVPDAGGQGQLRVYAMVPVGNFMYVSGLFGSIGGEFRTRLASLDLAMGVSVAWNPKSDGAVRSVVVARDQLFVSGEFTKIGDELHPYFAAFSLGSCFDPATLKRTLNGDIQCQVADGGSAGQNLLIQASTNMVDWTTIHTALITGFPSDFTDAEAANYGRRFYRALVQP